MDQARCGLDVDCLLDLPSCFVLFAMKNLALSQSMLWNVVFICAASELLRSILTSTLLCSLILCLVICWFLP